MENGEKALEQSLRGRSEVATLLVTDVVMPGRLTGADLAKAVRATNARLAGAVHFRLFERVDWTDADLIVAADTVSLHKPFKHAEFIAAAIGLASG